MENPQSHYSNLCGNLACLSQVSQGADIGRYVGDAADDSGSCGTRRDLLDPGYGGGPAVFDRRRRVSARAVRLRAIALRPGIPERGHRPDDRRFHIALRRPVQ